MMTQSTRAIPGLAVVGTVAALAAPEPGRPLCVSGVYPHLTTFNSVVEGDGRVHDSGGECGIGAVVPWAGRLWMITYSPHCPTGSTDKLFTIDADLNLEIRPESVGGTPAGRLIHRESEQLFIGPYAVDKQGGVRVIPYSRMPGRHTAVARHLTDPANLVYYFDMEGRIYEVDVHSLDVRLLFKKPVPGWHGKGGYTSQGRYVIANNGEREPGDTSGYGDLLVGGPSRDAEDAGALAEWDGRQWRVVERRQFTEVTGPGGILGAPDDNSPLWAVGWDRRSVLLKLLDGGAWYTFRLPKGSWTYDPRHGWYTEWPRIREIAPGQLMMDMHALFWDFPATFSAANTAGLRPLATHHRYVPDFCHWNGRVVIATDETTIMQNPMAGQSQSNLWFGQVEDIRGWGPRVGWGGVWVNDRVAAGQPSVPFALAGFDQRCLHLAVGAPAEPAGGSGAGVARCSGQFEMDPLPLPLAGLARVTIDRGDFQRPAPGFRFRVDQPVVVFLAVDARPPADLGPGWEKTDLACTWGGYRDDVYRRSFAAGPVDIPGHAKPHKPDAYGVPHLAFVAPGDPAAALHVTDLPADLGGRLALPGAAVAGPATPAVPGDEVAFTLEVDPTGRGAWSPYRQLRVPSGGYLYHLFPPDLQAWWVRLTADRECVATANFHYGESRPRPAAERALFAALADPRESKAVGAWIRPGKHTRNLQALVRTPQAGGGVGERYLEVDERLAFTTPAQAAAAEVWDVAAVSCDFSVDSASVILTDRGRRYRLPKGDEAYSQPFATGWPRGTRECESERYLMNLHGTFYERPRDDGFPRLKPVATHGKQILDFCTWRGLLVLSGVRPDARPDGHWFGTADGVGLWFGAIDDLWKLGKPVGQGGPWKDTAVRAGQASDPYLMTGYDRKRLELSHTAAAEVAFTVEVDVDHSGWRVYDRFVVPAGATVRHAFPDGYSAHWVRVRSAADCRATARFVYE